MLHRGIFEVQLSRCFFGFVLNVVKMSKLRCFCNILKWHASHRFYVHGMHALSHSFNSFYHIERLLLNDSEGVSSQRLH